MGAGQNASLPTNGNGSSPRTSRKKALSAGEVDESRDGFDSDRTARNVDGEVPLSEPHRVGFEHLVRRVADRHGKRTHQVTPSLRTGPTAMVQTALCAASLRRG